MLINRLFWLSDHLEERIKRVVAQYPSLHALLRPLRVLRPRRPPALERIPPTPAPQTIPPAPPGMSLSEIPFPVVDLEVVSNPTSALMKANELMHCAQALDACPGASRSLLGGPARALLFSLVRNLKPEHVVEIGTFNGGTAEAICRAIAANGRGVLHTVGPFDSERFLPFFETWPAALKERLHFYPTDSMAFFMLMEERGIHPDIVFVDGNHDYEFALFDIQCAARRMALGGFIVVDNVSQAGPYFAVLDFLAKNPLWLNCASRVQPGAISRAAFDKARSPITHTDFMILRAPAEYVVMDRPMTTGLVPWETNSVMGLQLDLAAAERDDVHGELNAFVVLRGFGANLCESAAGVVTKLDGAPGVTNLLFDAPLRLMGECSSYRVEPWLTWTGPHPLRLKAPPRVL